MTALLDGFGAHYVSALGGYLEIGDEAALNRSYELGRLAMGKGLGILDMALLHQAALGVLVVLAPNTERLRLADSAARFFAELLSPFEMSFRGYRGANETLQRLNESLRQQKDAVELANRELESFSYSVSHDLRAPLRCIDAFGDALLEDCGVALGDQGRAYVGRIRAAAKSMAKLIDDLMSLARVTRTELHRVEVNLTALARRIAGLLLATSPQRNVEFIIDEDMSGDCDAALLEVVLENLLGNAWKFTSKRARAEIRFSREDRDGKPTYFVRDNGSGFDMASAQRLFVPFERLHTESEFEGTGIGLATVQRVVHRHRGRVWANGMIDSGATFYFTLGDTPGP